MTILLTKKCRPSLETGGKRRFSFSACQWPSKNSILSLSLALSLQRLRTRADFPDNNNLFSYSLGWARLMHVLRSPPCHGHPRLGDFDELLRAGLERILNASLTDDQWTQASLPIRMGGLRVRRMSPLALPAFLSSAAGSLPIQSDILGSMFVDPDSACDSARSTWLQLAGDLVLTVMPGHKQSQWDRPLLNEVLSSLEERLQDPYDQARIKASQGSEASDWLHALPISARGLRP